MATAAVAATQQTNYLNAKKGAIANPNPVQVGSSRGPVYQYDENGQPVTDPNGKPVTKPDLTPGRNQPKILPIFPALPEPQTDEDRENDRRLKSKDLLTKVEEEIAGVEEQMGLAKKDLVTIETRFAKEATAR